MSFCFNNLLERPFVAEMLRFYATVMKCLYHHHHHHYYHDDHNVSMVPLLLWRLLTRGRGLVWGQLVNRHVRGWMSLADPWVISELCLGSKGVGGVLRSSPLTKTCVCVCDCDEVRSPVLLQGPVTQCFHQSLPPLPLFAVLSLL